MELHKLIRYTFLACSIGALAACDSANNSTPAPTSTTISGSVFASDVNGATVTVRKFSENTPLIDPVMTSADGSYSIVILDTDLASDLVFESTGGVFNDEETGAIGVDAGTMSAFVAGGTLVAGGGVHITPDSTIHSDLVTKYSKTPAEAQSAFFKAFAHNVDASVDPALTDGDDASMHAGWRAAVFSRLAKDLTLTPADQFDMFAAIAQDLSDDTMDGADASGAVEIGSTGVNAPALADYIATTESFKTAEAGNIKVTYAPPMMNVHGKNQFTLTITDSAGSPITSLVGGTDLKIMPMMYMTDRTHATPVAEIVETVPGVSGIYNVTVYYLMPSRMQMNTVTMGTWDLKVMANMETVHFYPNINMAMGDTVRSDPRLLGITDTIVNMDGLEVARPYNIFKDGDATPQGGGSNYDFDIFISPMETMMSFPPLVVGETLASGMGGTPLDVTSVEIEVNVNNGGWEATSAQPSGNDDGRWTLNTLQLDNPGVNEIKIRLIVNGETKTTDGLDAVADVNDSTPFTVTLP